MRPILRPQAPLSSSPPQPAPDTPTAPAHRREVPTEHLSERAFEFSPPVSESSPSSEPPRRARSASACLDDLDEVDSHQRKEDLGRLRSELSHRLALARLADHLGNTHLSGLPLIRPTWLDRKSTEAQTSGDRELSSTARRAGAKRGASDEGTEALAPAPEGARPTPWGKRMRNSPPGSAPYAISDQSPAEGPSADTLFGTSAPF